MPPPARGGLHLLRFGLVAVMAGGLVLAGPLRPAAAFVDGAARLSLPPSTVIGSLDSASASQRAGMVARLASAGAPEVATTASGIGLGSGLAVAGTGLAVGWTLGSGVASLFGLDSNGAVKELLGNIRPAPSSPPRGQADPARPPGWDRAPGLNVLFSCQPEYDSCVGGLTPYQVGAGSLVPTVSGPAYGVSSGTLSISSTPVTNPLSREAGVSFWDYADYGSGPQPAASGNGSLTIRCRSVDNRLSGRARADATSLSAVPAGGTVNFPASTPFECGANEVFDSVIQDIGGQVWYPEGAPQRPEQEVQGTSSWTTETRCSDGSVLRATSEVFAYASDSYPVPPQPPACPPGLSVDSVRVGETAPDGSVKADGAVVSEVPARVRDLLAARPECADGSCRLDLLRVQPDGSTVSCFSAPEGCRQWASDPAVTDNYRCTYGGQPIALSECGVYARMFESSDPQYVDPQTGAAPATGTDTGGDADPRGDAGAEQGRLERVRDRLMTRTPFVQVGSAFGALQTIKARPGACLVVPIKAPGGQVLTAFDSCGDDVAVTWLREHRALVTALVWLGFLAPLCWWAWRTYAPASTGSA